MYQYRFEGIAPAVTLWMKREPEVCVEDGGLVTLVWGHLYGLESHEFGSFLTKRDLLNCLGLFFGVQYHRREKKLLIFNDPIAGYRVYLYYNDGQLMMSDDWQLLIAHIHETCGKLTLNRDEFRYWLKTRFTTGDATLFNELGKLPPCAYVWIKGEKVDWVDTYLPDIPNIANRYRHVIAAVDALAHNLKRLLSLCDKLPVLFFSGGRDSTLLLLILKAIGVEFKVIHWLPMNLMTDFLYRQYKQVTAIADELGIKVEYVYYDTERGWPRYVNMAFHMHPFERVVPVDLLTVSEYVKTKYGEDVILLSGEIASTGFTPVPTTASKLRDLIARLTSSPYPWYGFRSGIPFIPHHKLRSYRAACIMYRSIVHPLGKVYAYLMRQIGKFDPKFRYDEPFVTYAKLFTKAQGMIPQGSLKPAEYFGLEIYFPYIAPEVIISRIKYMDWLYEIATPKYAVKLGIKRFGLDYDKVTDIKVKRSSLLDAKTVDIALRRCTLRAWLNLLREYIDVSQDIVY
ncbi:hypothetical protein CGW93_01575 [candidate division bacterium WOR-3 4484_18]|uniref:Asparagine synthetase domain-containing protein n=1 Tax=candidate division WOR-3 bacterium 4484_18 TaxID=2020626 RepID=A0A257LUF0_UNCW3|nr:MAG: hypothetical protein CGW93_01575 [candidate division bacterium WOR-3 4484_18]